MKAIVKVVVAMVVVVVVVVVVDVVVATLFTNSSYEPEETCFSGSTFSMLQEDPKNLKNVVTFITGMEPSS